MKMVREKKISVHLEPRKLKNGNNTLYSRVVYNQRSTKFITVMFGGNESEFTNEELTNVLEDKNWIDWYVSTIKSIVRYENIKVGDNYKLNKLGERLHFYFLDLVSVLNQHLEVILFDYLSDLLTHRNFNHLKSEYSQPYSPFELSTYLTELERYNYLLDIPKLVYLVKDMYDIDFELPNKEYDNLLVGYIQFIHFTYNQVFSKYFDKTGSKKLVLKHNFHSMYDGRITAIEWNMNRLAIQNKFECFLDDKMAGNQSKILNTFFHKSEKIKPLDYVDHKNGVSFTQPITNVTEGFLFPVFHLINR